jgi:hypothetical protein
MDKAVGSTFYVNLDGQSKLFLVVGDDGSAAPIRKHQGANEFICTSHVVDMGGLYKDMEASKILYTFDTSNVTAMELDYYDRAGTHKYGMLKNSTMADANDPIYDMSHWDTRLVSSHTNFANGTSLPAKFYPSFPISPVYVVQKSTNTSGSTISPYDNYCPNGYIMYGLTSTQTKVKYAYSLCGKPEVLSGINVSGASITVSDEKYVGENGAGDWAPDRWKRECPKDYAVWGVNAWEEGGGPHGDITARCKPITNVPVGKKRVCKSLWFNENFGNNRDSLDMGLWMLYHSDNFGQIARGWYIAGVVSNSTYGQIGGFLTCHFE